MTFDKHIRTQIWVLVPIFASFAGALAFGGMDFAAPFLVFLTSFVMFITNVIVFANFVSSENLQTRTTWIKVFVFALLQVGAIMLCLSLIWNAGYLAIVFTWLCLSGVTMYLLGKYYKANPL